MRKYIHIKKADREFLIKTFGVSAMTVYNAIHYDERHVGTDLAKRIRKAAIERGGIVMVVIPEAETLHDSDGYMRQYFPNGVLVEFSKMADASCDVLRRGEVVRHYDGVMLSDIPAIQKYAEGLK